MSKDLSTGDGQHAFDQLTRAQQRLVGDFVSARLKDAGRWTPAEFVRECQRFAPHAATDEGFATLKEWLEVRAKLAAWER